MAQNTAEFTLKLKSEGMDGAEKQSKAIRNNLEGAAEAASKTSKAIARSAAARPTGAAGTSAGITGGDVEEYNRAAGAAGKAGGSARDFADQARGLGGLVRLYATFAANAFAAAAAFGALSRAMDTTNMVKGLDQLGAASGRSLGTLSKRLVEATDGAVSLREAMEATAKSSAAGLTNKQILEMGEVAKKASLALGVNMTDALSRLSRGISKIEPELLDELGIYVKIDDAVQNYARSLGKTTTSLSDFERRQAFAVAALTQARDKFSAIDIDSNPYTKLNATFQNVLQSGLEIINKVLAPIAKLLSDSPAALALAVGLIGKTLLSQALPAVGQWREGIKKASEEANNAVIRAAEARKAMKKTIDSNIAETIGAAEVQSSKALEQKVNELLQKKLSKGGAAALQAITPQTEDIVAIEKQTSAIDKQIKSLEKRTYTNEKAKQANAIEIADLKQTKTLLEQKTVTLKKYIEAIEDAEPVNKTGLAYTFSREAANERRLASAIGRQQRTTALSETARAYDIGGAKDAWATLNQQIADFRKNGDASGQKMTALNAGFTRLTGVATIAAGAVGSIASALNIWTIGIGLAVGAFQLLDAAFSKNSKEQEETAKGFELLKEAGDNLDRTLESISKKDPLQQISTESLKARATAFGELASAVSDSFSKIQKQTETANWWDRFIDGWKSVVGKDLLSTSAKNLSFEVAKALQGAGSQAAELTKNLNKVTGIDVNQKGALENLLGKNPEKFFELLPKIQQELDKTQKVLAATAGASEQLDNNFKEASKTFDSILVSAIPTDPLAKLGSETVKVSEAMRQGFKDGAVELSNLAKISGDVSKLRFFDPKTAEFLLTNAKTIQTLATRQQAYNTALQENLQLESKLQAILNNRGSSVDEMLAAKRQLGEVRKNIQALTEVKTSNEAEMSTYLKVFRQGQAETFLRGANLIEQSIGQGFQKAALTVRGAFASRLGDTSAAIQEEAALKREELKLQLQQLSVQEGLITSNENLRAIQEKLYLQGVKNEQKTPEEKARTQALIDAITTGQTRYTGMKGFQAVKADLASGDEATQQAAMGAYNSAVSALALRGQRAQLMGSMQAVNITEETKKIDDQYNKLTKVYQISLERFNLQKKLNDLSTSQLAYMTEETVKSKEQLELRILAKQEQIAENAILKEIAKQQDTISSPGASPEAVDKARKALEEHETRLADFNNSRESKEKALAADQAQRRLDNEKKIFEYGLALDKQRFDSTIQQSNLLFEARKSQIDQDQRAGVLDPTNKIALDAALAADQERIRSKQALFNLEQEQIRKNFEFRNQLRAAQNQQQVNDIIKNIQASNTYYQGLRDNENSLTALKLVNIEKTSELNQLYSETQKITEGLASVFGDFGKNLGDVVKSLVDLSIKQDAYNKKIADLENRRKDLSVTDEESIELGKEIAKTENLKTKSEIQGAAAVAGSTKKLFKEKTAAYKSFALLEKTGQAISLALELEKFAVKIGLMESEVIATTLTEAKKTAATQTGFMARAGTYITEIFSKFTAMLGPFGPPLAAAAIAAIGLSAFGGSKSVSTVGMAAEDRQGLGAGQTYRDGKVVETGGGVFGDASAKSESIANSLEVIKSTSVEGLSFSNKMVTLLEGIKNGITGVAEGVYGVVGIRAGSAFNTQEGTSGRMVLGGLFGKTQTKEILDTGIALKGTFAELIGGSGQFIKLYETAKTTTTSSFLWIKRTSQAIQEQFKGLDEVNANLAKQIGSVFGNAAALFVELGTTLGMAAEDVGRSLESIPVDKLISLKDLKGDELEKELSSVLSSILDDTASTLFASLADYRQFGEGMLETVTRVIDANQKINLALTSIGKTALNVGKVLNVTSIAIADELVKLAGGLDKFIEQTDYFRQNFLTDVERLGPVQEAVTKELIKANAAGITTREQFKNLVLGLDLTTKAGQETYSTLMGVQESFYEVTQQYEDLIKEISDINTDSATKFMTEAQKIVYLRNKERDAILEVNKPLFDMITNLKLASLELDSATQALLDGYRTLTETANQARQAILTAAKAGLTALQDSAVALAQKGLTILQTEIDNTKQQILSLATQGLQALQTKLENAKAAVLQLATQGLQNLQSELENAKTEALNLASQGLQILQSELESTKTAALSLATQGLQLLNTSLQNANNDLVSIATQGLQVLNQKADDLKGQLISVAQEGLDRLTSELSKAEDALKDFASKGFQVLRENLKTAEEELDSVSKSIVDGYKAAKEARQKEVESLRTFSKTIKDFLKELSFTELSAGTQRQKLKLLKDEFSKTLELAKAGDTDAQAKLTTISKDLLSTAREQAGSKLEYMRTFADVTSKLEGVSIQVDEKLKDEQEVATTKVKTFGDALEAATTELDNWKKLLETTGITVAGAESQILAQNPIVNPAALQAKFDKATKDLAKANEDILNWSSVVGAGATTLATVVEAKTYTELVSEFNSLKTKVTSVRTSITSYITETNSVLARSGVTGDQLLAEPPNIAELETTVSKELLSIESALTKVNSDIVQYIKDTTKILTDAGIDPEDINRALSTVPQITVENVSSLLKEAVSKVASIKTDIESYITTTTATLKAAGFGDGQIKAALDTVGPVTVDNIGGLLSVAVGKVASIKTDIESYITTTTATLKAAGLGDGQIQTALNTAGPVTADNVKGLLSVAVAKVASIKTDIESYITTTTATLKAAGFGDGQIQAALNTAGPVTVDNIAGLLSEAVSKVASIKIDIEKYITNTNATLAAAGLTSTEIDRALTQAPQITEENISSLISELTGKLGTLKTDLTTYISDANRVLTQVGVGSDKLLKLPEEELSGSINTQVTGIKNSLTNLKDNILTYITETNTVLEQEGFARSDFLTLNLQSDLAPVKSAVQNAVDAYHTALANVQGWATQLTTLGISFTPYNPKEDTTLAGLTARFNTASTAFTSANNRITSWVNQIEALANSVKTPAVPAAPATPPTVTIPETPERRTALGGGGDASRYTRPTSRDILDYINSIMDRATGNWSVEDAKLWITQNGGTIDDLSTALATSGSRTYAMGGVFDERNLVKFANGGAFTNSVVSNPTMFSYGQMGEAGPEAIMPLHRDSTGSLGVKAALGGGTNNEEMVAELKALREEVAKLRQSSERNEGYSKKTKDTLVRVTRDGEGMVTV